ncbi:MAG: trypsin-like peptidase domain-containing protein [Verrucomicrobiota bacterium]
MAILSIFTFLTPRSEAGQFGTGFAINSRGYLITCLHVIHGAEKILIHHPLHRLEARVIALDRENDLVLLKVEGWQGKHLGLVETGQALPGDQVLAAGFPDPSILGVNPKVSRGFINALSGVRDDPRFLQISVPLQPGNSGGPIIGRAGQVMGIVTSGLNSIDRMDQGGYVPQAVNYAAKSDVALRLIAAAGVSPARFGTRSLNDRAQIDRALGSIVLVEGLQKGQPSYLDRRQPFRPPPARYTIKNRPGEQPSSATRRPSLPSMSLAETSRHTPRLMMAPASPWVFTDSDKRRLTERELNRLTPNQLWTARNEIYLRRGYQFTSRHGLEMAAHYGSAYRPVTSNVEAIVAKMNPIEIDNLRLIAAREAQHQN